MKNLTNEQLDWALSRVLANYDGSEVAQGMIAVLNEEINKRNEFKSFFDK